MAEGIAPAARARPPRGQVLVAYATVYLVWGSTYLAIAYAIETLPPFLMAGARFLVAGALLFGWARLRGAGAPSGRQWRNAIVVGAFLLLGGNGAVVWAEQRVPSGVAALLVSVLPIWMVLLEAVGPERRRPTVRGVVGVLVGILGVAVLIGPDALLGRDTAAGGAAGVHVLGAITLVLGSLSWGIGSMISRFAALPKSAPLGSGMQMLAGGLLLALLGFATGESPAGFATATPASLLGFLYLIVFGSLVGFTAFAWLLRVEPPSRVATYAYVNPVVAVLLGWAIAGEPVSARTLVAAAVIVGAVALIVSARKRPTPAPSAAPVEPPERGPEPAREPHAGERAA